jgi:hypothetical protein
MTLGRAAFVANQCVECIHELELRLERARRRRRARLGLYLGCVIDLAGRACRYRGALYLALDGGGTMPRPRVWSSVQAVELVRNVDRSRPASKTARADIASILRDLYVESSHRGRAYSLLCVDIPP